MPAKIFCATLIALDALIVEVQVDVSAGLPSTNIVGLADTSIRESKERVRACLRNAHNIKYPLGRIIINLAPAHLYKYGTQFDLAIAVGILIASGQCNFSVASSLFLGELSLDGSIRPVRGVLAMTMAARQNSIATVFVPKENHAEAAAVSGVRIIALQNIQDLFEYYATGKCADLPITPICQMAAGYINFAEIVGQQFAKRGLEIAAAGGHNISLCGPPGSGKSMLAQALVSIMPPLQPDQELEIIKIYSIAGLLEKNQLTLPPFRSPHHSITFQAFVGGSARPRPGEISLAHQGILFLDELPEFSPEVIESLRQPLENGVIKISRVQGSAAFPANFILITAQNPCPCGFFQDPQRECLCTPGQIQKYARKISGPILDRIDMQIKVPRLALSAFQKGDPSIESSEQVAIRVAAARSRQYARYGRLVLNCKASAQEITAACELNADAHSLLARADAKYHFSGRAYYRLLKISRTIADLAGKAMVAPEFLAEALQYKFLA